MDAWPASGHGARPLKTSPAKRERCAGVGFPEPFQKNGREDVTAKGPGGGK